MKKLTKFEWWYGRNEPPPETVRLKAGPLDLEFEAGDLRYIRAGGQELVRRVYVAIRDVNWNTIPGQITNLSLDAGEDHFRIEFDALHQDGSLQFRWHAVIDGQPDGRIEYTMDGLAESDFRYCRSGFCVLHPIAGVAGQPYQALTPTGPISGVLPELVGPQHIVNGFESPIFPSCSSLTMDLSDSARLSFDFEGDLFEMEDQRNWTDGSFKTYCTPLSLGYPHQATTGQQFHQKVTLKTVLANHSRQIEAVEADEAIRLTLSETALDRLPPIGFGLGNHDRIMPQQKIDLLANLAPDHLKAELRLAASGWHRSLKEALAVARQIDCPLELALFLSDHPEEAQTALRSHLDEAPIVRVIVFHEAEAARGTTSPQWVELTRRHLADILPGVRFMGGTNGNFAELNRQRPDIRAMDGVAYTINPQVHAWDERSLIETIEAQRDTVATARSFCGSLPICISSVTLKPPFNVVANEAEGPSDPQKLPAAVDQRQMSLFAAAWTVGSLRSLTAAGVDSITYFETIGWQGLMETLAGSPLPKQFRSSPDMIFPVYYVFAFLADKRQANLLPLKSARPLRVEGLALKQDNRIGLLAANLQPQIQKVRLGPLPVGEAALRRLNTTTMALASADPAAFLNSSEALSIQADQITLTLEPYETAWLEVQPA